MIPMKQSVRTPKLYRNPRWVSLWFFQNPKLCGAVNWASTAFP